jgi:hypothetical protein
MRPAAQLKDGLRQPPEQPKKRTRVSLTKHRRANTPMRENRQSQYHPKRVDAPQIIKNPEIVNTIPLLMNTFILLISINQCK